MITNDNLSIYIESQPRKKDIRTGTQRHCAKKKERIKSKLGKVNKLKGMLQKRLKTVKNKCCGLGRVMWSKMISNDQELIQSDPTSCPQNQKGNN